MDYYLAEIRMSRRFVDLKERQCTKKVPFEARRDAKRSMRRRFTDYRNMHVYKCPWCGSWHVGHKQGRPKVKGKHKPQKRFKKTKELKEI